MERGRLASSAIEICWLCLPYGSLGFSRPRLLGSLIRGSRREQRADRTTVDKVRSRPWDLKKVRGHHEQGNVNGISTLQTTSHAVETLTVGERLVVT